MDLECHQLGRRYEPLRTRDPRKERRLLASLAEYGQQLPVVVVAADERFILVDGYKRLRALTRLAQDWVRAPALGTRRSRGADPRAAHARGGSRGPP